MFDIVFTYKVALFPYPSVFITASSEVPATFLLQVKKDIISNIVDMLERAQKNYKAIVIVNEPTEHTHNLNFSKSKNGIAVYCSLQFQSINDMYTFIHNEIQTEQ